MKTVLLLIGIATATLSCRLAKNGQITQNNYQSAYDNFAALKVKHKVISLDGNFLFFLNIKARRISAEHTPEAFRNGIRMSYEIKNSYASKESISIDSLTADQYKLTETNGSFLLEFTLPRPAALPAYVFLRIEDRRTGQNIVDDILLPDDTSQLNIKTLVPRFVSGIALMKNYVLLSDQIKIESVKKTEELTGYYYSFDFPPAQPPMATTQKNAKKNFKPDSLFNLRPDSILSFRKKGLYYFQEDTSSNKGSALRVENNRFPKYTTAEDLLQPTIYISTDAEINLVKKSTDKKKTLDAFWLKQAGNANQGKRLIKEYYDRVEFANEEFESYKEGWKTDMGMIYIVFGNPDKVFRSEDKEEWIYEKSSELSEVRFTFVKIPNIFSNNHFELLRYPEYEKFWYAKVELWRKGSLGL